MEDKKEHYEEQGDTILNFIYMQNENEKLSEFIESIHLGYANKTVHFKDLNYFKIDLELMENCHNYNEMFTIKTRKNSDIFFDYFIYTHKKNNIYIDYQKCSEKNDSDNLNSLQIIYQSIKSDLLPNYIDYSDMKLNLFDTFENKLRKRISLVNIEPNKLKLIAEIYKEYPNFHFENQNSYEIYVRIPKEGKIQYSVANLELFDCNRLKNNYFDKTLVFKDKNKTLENLKDFRKEVLFEFLDKVQIKIDQNYINNINNNIKKLYDKYKIIELNAVYYYNNVLNYNQFESIDIDIFHEIFYFLEFVEIKKKIDSKEEKMVEAIEKREEANEEKNEIKIEEEISEIKLVKNLEMNNKENQQIEKHVKKKKKPINVGALTFINLAIDFNKKYEEAITEIKNLEIDIKDKLLLIKSYNRKFIESIQTKYEIKFIQTLNIEKENFDNAYKKAVIFIKNIIENIEENSRLFEAFLYLDSDTIENILINQKEEEKILKERTIKHGKHPTELGINMLNINEVKAHLFNLLPKYIIRISTEMKFNASYDQFSKIMFINENQLFREESNILTSVLNNPDSNQPYILPLAIEILHELFGHGKKRFIDSNAKSSEEYRDSQSNFVRNSIKKNIGYNEIINYPESGIVLENFISKNRGVIKWLKSYHDEEEYLEKIMNINIWVDKDFSKLELLVGKYISLNKEKYDNISLYYTNTYSNDEDFINSDDDMCGFHKSYH